VQGGELQARLGVNASEELAVIWEETLEEAPDFK
jgi:hypothetical protein